MPSYTVKDLPASDRPRERLQRQGTEALSDAELLALVLRAGSAARTVVELCQAVLAEYDLDSLADASLQELTAFDGIGPVKAGQLVAVSELCRRVAARPQTAPDTEIDTFQAAVPHVEEMARFSEERVGIICVDAANAVIAKDLDLLHGSIDRVRVDTRVIVREAVRQNAAGVILAHNHPSGDPAPSDNDVAVTETVQSALSTVGVELLDHIIVGEETCTSLKKEGAL